MSNVMDVAVLESRLNDWIRACLDNPAARISGLRRPGTSGFSNDTLLARLSSTGDSADDRQIVIRVAPPVDANQIFPFYDIPKQFDIMQMLGQHTGVPVPGVLWKEEDRNVLGEVFYVMEHIEGQIPADNPPYTVEGFVVDASPEERRAMWLNGIDAMVHLHKQDYKAAGLGFLEWPDRNRSPIAQHLEYYEHYLHWAARGRPQPVAEAALAWLKAHMPEDEPLAISWGDARMGNLIFKGTEVQAILDWEMAVLGSPEMDLGWWLFVDKTTMRGNGMPDWSRPRLDGLPSHEETIAHFEKQLGHQVKHLRFYEIFAGFRFACVYIRIMQKVGADGLLPVELTDALESDNVITQLLTELMAE